MSRIMLEPYISGPQSSPETVKAIGEWIEENGLRPANIPAPGAYVVRNVLRDNDARLGWVLVAQRYVRNVHGMKVSVKGWPGHYQKTISIATPVTTPPSFLLPQGDPS